MRYDPTMSNNVLITGAGNRIGAAIAEQLASDGCAVIIHHNNSISDAEKLAATIKSSGGRAALVRADLTNPSERAGLIEAAAKPFGALDILINNASIFEPDSALTIYEELWNTHFALHLQAPVFLARDFVRQLASGKKGNIINIIDESVLYDTPSFFSYNLSKTALWHATRTLAQSFAPDIRVNAIGPGPTLPHTRQNEEQFSRSVASLPLKTSATPDQIVSAIRYLLSTPSMTGQMLALDGGEHLQWQTRRGITPAETNFAPTGKSRE